MARNKINLHNDFLFKKRISTSNNVLSNLKSYTVESTPEVKKEEPKTPEIEVEEPKTEETPEVKEETPEVKGEEETETEETPETEEEEDPKTEEETPETGEEEPKTEVTAKAKTVSKK